MANSFWCKQPVSRGYTTSGIIAQEVPGALEECKQSSASELHDFINATFDTDYYRAPEYFRWHMDVYVKMTAENDGEVIGCIGGKRFLLVVGGDVANIAYVDHLTVAAIHRKVTNAAVVLISNAAQFSPAAVFKKDDVPLPFDYLCAYQYFGQRLLIDGSTSSMRPIQTKLDGLLAQQYYERCSLRFPVHVLFQHHEDFWSWLCEPCANRVTLYRNAGGVSCLASFVLYKWHGIQTAELFLFLSDQPRIDIVRVKQYAMHIGCDFFICNNMGMNAEFLVAKNEWREGKKSYLHLYNYATKRPYAPQEVLFPIS